MDMLQITFHEGVGLAGGFFNSRDPYVVATIGAQKVHTTVINNGGKNPKWEQTFTIPYEGEDSVQITVYDQDVGKDDVMGEGRMDLTPLRSQKRWTTSIPIERKGKPAGTVRISVCLKEGRETGSGNNNQNQPPTIVPIPVPYPYPQAGGYQSPSFNQGGYQGPGGYPGAFNPPAPNYPGYAPQGYPPQGPPGPFPGYGYPQYTAPHY